MEALNFAKSILKHPKNKKMNLSWLFLIKCNEKYETFKELDYWNNINE